MDDLVQHLMARMGEGGHGFVTGIPIMHESNAVEFHEKDHAGSYALSHDHDLDLHLITPLAKGGHGYEHPPFDSWLAHEVDHTTGAWWAHALTHDHNEEKGE